MFLDVLVKIGIPSFATKTASTAPPALLLILCILAQRIKIQVPPKSFFPTPQNAHYRRQQP